MMGLRIFFLTLHEPISVFDTFATPNAVWRWERVNYRCSFSNTLMGEFGTLGGSRPSNKISKKSPPVHHYQHILDRIINSVNL